METLEEEDRRRNDRAAAWCGLAYFIYIAAAGILYRCLPPSRANWHGLCVAAAGIPLYLGTCKVQRGQWPMPRWFPILGLLMAVMCAYVGIRMMLGLSEA